MKRYQRNLIIASVVVVLIPSSLFIFNSSQLAVTPYELVSDQLPNEFDGFKIIQISDLHNHSNEYANKNLAETILEQQPDAIVLTGDIVDEYTSNLENLEAIISGLASIPTYYSNGNHDIGAPLYENFIAMITSHGVIDVSGNISYFSQGASRLAFVGFQEEELNMSYGLIGSAPNAVSSLSSLVEGVDEFSILLSHHPDLYQEIEGLGIDLMLSGHFHGGHVRLFNWSPINWVDSRFGGGQFVTNETTQIVSRGLGSGFFKFRINCDAEIVVITLKTLD